MNKVWRGEAFIPNEYFPPNVDKFNAYAIHGQPENQRIYKGIIHKPRGQLRGEGGIQMTIS